MPKAAVNVETNLEDGAKAVQKMTDKIPESADDASKIIAHRFIRESKLTMQRNDSVVTGQGANSLHTESGGDGQTLVFGASYLRDLDTGTQAHWPDADSTRFRAAARSYGLDRYSLARTIAQKGTRPHPWIRETTERVNRSADERLKTRVDKAISESIR